MGLSEKLTEIKSELTSLISYSNGVTGKSDARIGDVVRSLADGFGQGESGADPFFGMLNDMYAYGTCDVAGTLTERQNSLYVSFPNAVAFQILYHDKTIKSGSHRYVGFASCYGRGYNTGKSSGADGEYGYFLNGTATNTYGVNTAFYGTSNGQGVDKLSIPAQTVNVPSDGYYFTVMMWKLDAGVIGGEPNYVAERINLGKITLNTWETIRGDDKVYIGWNPPILDA